jgi:hypothetical protein
MNRYAFSLAIAIAVQAAALTAQSPVAAQVTTSAVCLPSGTPDELVKALDDAISGPGDKDRTCLRALFMPDARLNPLSHSPDGGLTPHLLLLDDWVAAIQRRGSAPLYEWQIRFTAESFGPMAHIWSTFEVRATPDGPPVQRGINSIQAVYYGKRWRIFEVLWLAESPEEQIPAKYLP